MALELEGRIVRKLNVQSGTSARGAWSKQEFIFEYQEGNFPSQVCMNVWGEDKVKDLDKYQVGDKVKVSFNLSSREFNGRWYTDVRAWRIEPAAQQAAPGPDYAASAGAYAAPTGAQGVPPVSMDEPYAASAGAYSAPLDEEDLPF
jgi:ribosomal protein L21E